MGEWEWTLTIETGQKGGPGSGHHGHAGRPGKRGGSAPGKGGGGGTRRDKARAWLDNLTEREGAAIFRWGQSGYGIRKLQSGHPEKLDDRQREWAEHDLPHWESALAKGVRYEGTIYRGLTGIPESVISTWKEKGTITLNNDQSATKNEDYGKDWGYAGRGSKRETNALWKVDQRSGIDLFERTNVTYGLKPRDEQEVVMRKGSTYRINSMTYYRKTGDKWPPPGYFEGTEWSEDNPPPDWQPHHDFNGYYLIEMEEV